MDNEELSPMEVLAGLRAGIDQMIANAPDVARVHRAMYNSFLEEGFTSEQALWLAAAQFKSLEIPEGDES